VNRRPNSSAPPDAPPGVLVGRNPVREALERGDGRVEKVFLQQGAPGSGIDAIRHAAKAGGVPVQVVPAQKIDRLAPGATHQGVAALAAAVGYLDLDEMLSGIAPDLDAVRATKPLLVALDEIEDPHNLGAILRSAVAAGAAGALVPERRSAPLGATALKASAGTALRLPVARVTNLAESLLAMKERGYWVVGLEGGAEAPGDPERTTVWDWDWDRASVVVVGNEGRGLRPRVRQACDALAGIPMAGPAESLNASVAAGIALLYAARVRG
jgi:23S rRNA (guanosine2251-2'-O)-methyltransferase